MRKGGEFKTTRRRDRLHVCALALIATLTFAHMLDRIAAGSTACAIEHPAQCPDASR